MIRSQTVLLCGIAMLSPCFAENIPPAATGHIVYIPGNETNFIKSTATFAISALVEVNWRQDSLRFAVSTAHSNGMHTFGASTTSAIYVSTCETTSVSTPRPQNATLGGNGCD